MDFPAYLKGQLAARGWSKSDLARAAGVSKQSVGYYTSDDTFYRVTPSPQACERMAAALGVDMDEVLEAAGHRKRPAVIDTHPLDAERRETMQLLTLVPDDDLATVKSVIRRFIAAGPAHPHDSTRIRTRTSRRPPPVNDDRSSSAPYILQDGAKRHGIVQVSRLRQAAPLAA